MKVFACFQRYQRANTVLPATPPAIRLRKKNWGVRYFSESNFRIGGGRTETSAEASGVLHPADVVCNSVVWVMESRRPRRLLTSWFFVASDRNRDISIFFGIRKSRDCVGGLGVMGFVLLRS
jgi:hypothetical protein